MSDLSPEMQWQCHRVSQKACDTIFGLLMDRWKMPNKTDAVKKPSPRQMVEWLESYFDCDDIHNNCPEPKWAQHIRDFIKEHGHVS